MSGGILHCSDPHFGAEVPAVVEALLRLAKSEAPDLVIVSGDITQRARRCEFAAARQFLDRLRTRTLVIPGNHDIPVLGLARRLLRPYGAFQRQLARGLEPEFSDARLLVIGVNTTRWWRHTHGEVSIAQIERVSARLAAADSRQLRLVVTHQPVHVMRERDEHNRLRGHAQAIQAWNAAGADLILGGHIHLPFWHNLQQTNPALPRATWALQAGTAVSRRVRFEAPNSVNFIRHTGASSMQLERWDYARADDAFLLVDQISAGIDRRGRRRSR